ncbi:MAG TPA: hypothetical protein VG738_23160 [Chitinophagaceae bacterium]|nr:hypothetical protein [Chitinophagaceae bacterium]
MMKMILLNGLKTTAISWRPDAAIKRGEEFGWTNIFKAAKEGTPDKWNIGSVGAKSFGVGVHALADAMVHQGVKMKDHSINKDLALGKDGKEAYTKANGMEESALLVVEILNGNFSHFADAVTLHLSGMTDDQRQQVVDALKKGNFGLK